MADSAASGGRCGWLRWVYLVFRESFLHPRSTSIIHPDGTVTRV